MTNPALVALVDELRKREPFYPDHDHLLISQEERAALCDALSGPVAAPPLEPTDEWLGKHLQPRGVCDRGCMCEDDRELRRDVFDGLREALAVAAPPEGTPLSAAVTREEAEARLTDTALKCVIAESLARIQYQPLDLPAMRGEILAALFAHDGSRT